MPTHRTKRGSERTPLTGDCDVLICGASFAGLAVARELAGADARVLVVDRYEIGERQTSACAAPTEWLRVLGLEESIRQTFSDLVIHTPHVTARMALPWTFSTFDYRELCALLWEQCDAEFETAKVNGRATASPAAPGRRSSMQMPEPNGEGRVLRAGAEEAAGICVETDRGPVAAPLVVDALGWRRILAGDGGFQPPDAALSRGLEVHPWGASAELEIWIDRGYVPAGYSWSFPASDEVRLGVGSFDPRFHVKEPTLRLADDLERDAVRFQGNWIPHRLRPAAVDGIFFAGDSAGHCLPLTAEGIRTALYFGIACGRELRSVIERRKDREEALRDYAAFSASHRWKFESMLRVQRAVPRVPPRLLALALRGMSSDAFVRWSFGHYLNIAPPEFAVAAPQRAAVPAEALAA
jgi:menaquinone-9 beta-reductase